MKHRPFYFLKSISSVPGTPRYPRTPLDAFLEFLRFTKVLPYIPKDARLLDIGAGDGAFLRYVKEHVQFAVGMDSHLPQAVDLGKCHLVSGSFPHDFEPVARQFAEKPFDVITMMAVTEHIPMEVYSDVADACWKYLSPNGLLICTVQHPRVEKLLDLLKELKIVEGFSIHEHYGFDPDCLPEIFNQWVLIKRERWGFGCNNLLLFRKRENSGNDGGKCSHIC